MRGLGFLSRAPSGQTGVPVLVVSCGEPTCCSEMRLGCITSPPRLAFRLNFIYLKLFTEVSCTSSVDLVSMKRKACEDLNLRTLYVAGRQLNRPAQLGCLPDANLWYSCLITELLNFR